MPQSRLSSDFLRVRLSPPRMDPNPTAHRTSLRYFTPITLGQTVLAPTLPGLAKTWSQAPSMGGQLVDAAAKDMEPLLVGFPALRTDLSAALGDLQWEWSTEIDSPKSDQYDGGESLTHMASQILLNRFVYNAFQAIQNHLRPADSAAHKCRWKPEHNIQGCKHLTDLPRVLEDVKTRASVLGIVDVKVTNKTPIQDWSTLVNKGALYQEVNHTDFVLFFSVTALIVGYRTGTRLLWSDPIYNRRDNGDEFEVPNDPEIIQEASDLVFGGAAPQSAQTGLPLLFLAVMLRGAMKQAPWLQQYFPSLCGLRFNAAAADPSLNRQAILYLSTGMKKEDDDKANRKRGDDDKNGDYTPTKRALALAQNTLWSGPQSFAGRWYGELATPAGYSVIIAKQLSHGSHGVVYAGQLWQAGFLVSDVAIKVSDAKNTMLDEFARYEDLKDVMGHHIPRCYGVFVVDGGAFLVMELLESRDTVQSARERAAVYEVLSRLHKAGWIHNDIVDAGLALRNLAWARSGHVVLIDLITVTRHDCHDTCEELEGARNILHSAEPRVIV
ncbi:hypothetical protein DFH08DRAFT_490789 [Mycena albidolilacea]|uniref:Protein kinase domain-containing protein n=1 Tax=Mycena albidolilacea TaxID=1033008 RepID=A0AAD7EB70_9AGAR|nr:hypothetical protein DFH08DRAFT_490789 [Mycena albidolilacea]